MSDPNSQGQPQAQPPEAQQPAAQQPAAQPPAAPSPAAPPPQQSWQSTPQPPSAPPALPGPPSQGMPAWTANLTARDTMAGPGGVALADAPSRFIAAFIDFLILGVIGWILNMITTSVLGDNYLGIFGSSFRTQSLIGAIVTVAVLLAISAAYFIYMWTRMNGSTLGMRVMKLSVRDQATGGPITQSQAITRWIYFGAPMAINFLYGWSIGIIVSLLVLVYYIYLIVTIAQDPMRQGLHDKQAKTVVAKVA